MLVCETMLEILQRRRFTREIVLAASKNGNKLFSDEPVTPISNQRTILRTKGSQYLIRAKRKTEKQTDQYLQSISPNLQDAASRIKFRAPQIETPTRKSSLILFPTEQPPKVNIVQESQHYSQIPFLSSTSKHQKFCKSRSHHTQQSPAWAAPMSTLHRQVSGIPVKGSPATSEELGCASPGP